MSNSHDTRYYLNLILSFCFISGSVFMLLALLVLKENKGDWIIWGGIACFGLCTGLYLLLSAAVHKVKSDFIKKQRTKQRFSHDDN